MSKSYRNNPRRALSFESTFTRFEFDRMFPDDAACLDWLFKRRYPDGVDCPNCKRITPHYRESGRPSYSCHCGHHVHPMTGTIFERSATSLRLWFLAIYLMATTRCGISAKQLERELGVTYKCAWRIFKQIRSMLDEDVMNMLGEIEVDETFVGGRNKNKHANKKIGQSKGPFGSDKTPVFGAMERNGRVYTCAVPDTKLTTLLPMIQERVLPKSVVYSDEATSYEPLEKLGYEHKRVHHAEKVYVIGDAHVNTLEGFWAQNGLRGVHHAVSKKYLQTYFNEFAFRWNHRNGADPMFFEMLEQVPASDAQKQDA